MSGELKSYTVAGATCCWGVIVPHINWRGITLTPRIERETAREGWRAKTIMGLPVAERTHDGRFIYALPGGGSLVYG